MRGPKKKGAFGAGLGTSDSAGKQTSPTMQNMHQQQHAGLLSRSDFMKGMGLAGAGIAAAGLGMGNIAKAQTPPTELLDVDYLTLAAFVDTIVPGVEGNPVTIYKINELGNVVEAGTLENLGADGTTTLGAADPITIDYGIPPLYIFLEWIFPSIAYYPNAVVDLITTLNGFSENQFKNLPYENREELIKTLISINDLTAIIIDSQGLPYEDAYAQAYDIRSLLNGAIATTHLLYTSEYCNLVPSGIDSVTSLPSYKRNADNSWPIIPGGAWDQAGYPGPAFKNPSYACRYRGLKMTIADGKLKFIR